MRPLETPQLSLASQFRAALIIKGVTFEDEGTYQVVANNEWGSVKSAVKLAINEGEWMLYRIDEWMVRRMDGWVGGWEGGWVGGWAGG